MTDTLADELNNGTLYAPRYEEAFLPKGKNGLGRFASSTLPHCQEAFLTKNDLGRFVLSALPH